MRNSVYLNRRDEAYTLIEILVVISIIVILVGMIFSSGPKMIGTTKDAHDQNTAMNLRNAISAYFTDYRKYPVLDSSSEYLDLASDVEFMNPLLGADTPEAIRINPRRTTYFSGRTATKLARDRYVKGIAFSGENGAGSLWDSRGRMFGVRIDLKNRERMPNPWQKPPKLSGTGAPEWGSGQSSSQQQIIAESVAVWAAGEDMDRATDNIVSW